MLSRQSTSRGHDCRRFCFHARIMWMLAAVFIAPGMTVDQASAHIFIFDSQRAGSVPCNQGAGWVVECFYDLPDEVTTNLLTVEAYIDTIEPTFTFRADYIDWPAGATVHAPDTTFATLGDFFNAYVSDFSDPEALNLPFDHFAFRATGYLNAQIPDSSYQPAPPVWIELALAALDGGRVRVDETTIFRIVVPIPPDGFFTENAIIDLPGAYPIQITYFQKYDPDGSLGAPEAGVELYSCNEGGLDGLTLGNLVICYGNEPAKGMPKALIYDESQLDDVMFFDYDVDTDIDFVDFGYFQRCYTGPDFPDFLESGCETFDADFDGDIDLTDFLIFDESITGPEECL